uniref:MARVEL domain-containing protein n=1 Tax=Fusarium oxysporum (strain Fo5176) TaxID=660025 RepID=A0A0D2XTD1_FUSOF
MTSSGSGHKVASVILRFLELACGAIVLGLLGHFCDLVNEASNISVDGRIIYAMVVAGITIVYSIVFFAPFDILFMAFPFDFILFIMWLVAFCLLETRTRSHICSAEWYYNYWGYYWGRFWRVGPVGRVSINGAGCSEWRTVLAFSIINLIMLYIELPQIKTLSPLILPSGIESFEFRKQGIYVFTEYIHFKETVSSAKQQMRKLSHSNYPANGQNRESTATGAA